MGLYDYQLLAERFARSGGKRITLTAETARIVTHALRFYADVVANPKDEGNFTVDVWGVDGGIVETMARTSGILVAKAAFHQACLERLGYRVTLRQGIRLVDEQTATPTSKSTT